jgi:hypothetical protein
MSSELDKGLKLRTQMFAMSLSKFVLTMNESKQHDIFKV